MFFTPLENRGLLRISGDPAHDFLQNLVTTDLSIVDKNGAAFSGLLTPQGKIQFDFFIVKSGESYLIEVDRTVLQDLKKRLTFYRLRTKVEIDVAEQAVFAVWDSEIFHLDGALVFRDPRLDELGYRVIGQKETVSSGLQTVGGTSATFENYQLHRLKLGVPESSTDFSLSDIFPHDADMDALQGVSFSKGCYVGQEIVSRMQHRGTARKRFVKLRSKAELPEAGSDVMADGKSVGHIGSHVKDGDTSISVALLRLDKVRAALDKGATITCGEAPVEVDLPAWATFDWPETTKADH
ncbi:hypothetical protein JM93_02260 [Roseibium hamelinense]|uniref:CAF17 C-terminal domain-containing protein n=1 Tax=Roseibium hamelinense TaxID=150831 RepID=A0A562T1W9_9HYPH|nr:folate-binding protein YgfZ [Roseibium hamelinense]MTI42288.1 folate-binding protein [Roseibium hamelinense]TWI87691.1 hypothetical protein JM93_02260 [Roseibium hamelinense]